MNRTDQREQEAQNDRNGGGWGWAKAGLIHAWRGVIDIVALSQREFNENLPKERYHDSFHDYSYRRSYITPRISSLCTKEKDRRVSVLSHWKVWGLLSWVKKTSTLGSWSVPFHIEDQEFTKLSILWLVSSRWCSLYNWSKHIVVSSDWKGNIGLQTRCTIWSKRTWPRPVNWRRTRSCLWH